MKKIIYIFFAFFGIILLVFVVNSLDGGVISCDGVVKDNDGNTYKIVQIGNQCWFAENLATTKYRNGKPILEAENHVNADITWNSEKNPVYTWLNHLDYEGLREEYVGKYGYLYNWHVVNLHNKMDDTGYEVCPRGWSVPTHDDWTELELFICKDSRNQNCEHFFSYDERRKGYYGTDEGNKLKSVDFTRIEEGTDDYGFSALPGGLRYDDGAFSPPNFYAAWWSSTGDEQYAWIRELYDTERESGRFFVSAENAHSIRCIKNR